MGWIRCVRCKKFQRDFMARTSLNRFASSFVRQPNGPECTKIVRNAPNCEFRIQCGDWVRFPPFGCILEQFCYCTKLGAKRAKLVQLMQKFVQRCLVRIFQNERSRSTPLDPKLMFWCVSFRLGAFGTVSLLHKTCCKTRQTGAINAKV